jgi:hypothetical protein
MWRLRSALGKLLAEHVVVVEDATRAAVTTPPTSPAAGQLVNATPRTWRPPSTRCSARPAAKDFQSLWASHVDELIAYAGAAAKHDTARQDQARAGLATFETRMATFLEGATGKRLAETTLADALKVHDQALLQHADAYSAKDYTTAHDCRVPDVRAHVRAGPRTGQRVRLPGGGAPAGRRPANRIRRPGGRRGASLTCWRPSVPPRWWSSPPS